MWCKNILWFICFLAPRSKRCLIFVLKADQWWRDYRPLKVLLIPVKNGVRGLRDVPVILLQDVKGRLLVQFQPDALLLVDQIDQLDDLDGQVDVPPRQGQRSHANRSIDGTSNNLPDYSYFVKIFAFTWNRFGCPILYISWIISSFKLKS